MVARRVVGRTVVRTAAVGGIAYGVGHHMATKSAQQQQMDAEQNAQLADLQQQQEAAAQPMYQQPAPPAYQPPPPAYQQPVYPQAAYPPPQPAEPAPSGGLSDEAIARLKQLGELHEAGTLTDAEFEAAKQKILGV